jgi:hypothetical protein
MMKALFLSLVFSVSAQAACIGEAQIIGSISHVKKSSTGCRAFLSSDTRIQQSMVCPLSESKLQSVGIEVGLVNGHDCRAEAGDSISGVLVDNGYLIYLD